MNWSACISRGLIAISLWSLMIRSVAVITDWHHWCIRWRGWTEQLSTSLQHEMRDRSRSGGRTPKAGNEAPRHNMVFLTALVVMHVTSLDMEVSVFLSTTVFKSEMNRWRSIDVHYTTRHYEHQPYNVITTLILLLERDSRWKPHCSYFDFSSLWIRPLPQAWKFETWRSHSFRPRLEGWSFNDGVTFPHPDQGW